MTEALIGVVVALLAGALVSVVAVYLHFVVTGDLDATGLDSAEKAKKQDNGAE